MTEGLPINWFGPLSVQLEFVSGFLRTCFHKTIAGGWCTSVRFQTVQNRGCVLGCMDVRDELSRYLRCPILWQLACETLHIREESISILHRTGLIDASPLKFKTLAFCNALYHSVVNDHVCNKSDGLRNSFPIVQRKAQEICRHVLHLIGGR